MDFTTQTCVAMAGVKTCPPGCTDCDLAIGSIKCTACQDGLILDTANGICNLDCEKKGMYNCQTCGFTDVNRTQSKCFKCQPGFILNPELGVCKIIPSCQVGSVYNLKNNNCTACPEFCDGCKIEYLTNNATGEITGNRLTCGVCAPKYKLDSTGKCVYAGDTFVQVCSYGCQTCSINTKLSLLDCTECKTPFMAQINATTGITECKLQCP